MIHVADVDATARWYQELGFTLERWHDDGDGKDWALVRLGESEVMFNEGGVASTAHRREVDLYVHTPDVAADWERLKDRVEVVERLHDTFYGTREFIIRDPNRFWITFGQTVATA
jgi:catechol 2,3-dioxygenase-like lactoylglutathione lyase family enzyme